MLRDAVEVLRLDEGEIALAVRRMDVALRECEADFLRPIPAVAGALVRQGRGDDLADVVLAIDVVDALVELEDCAQDVVEAPRVLRLHLLIICDVVELGTVDAHGAETRDDAQVEPHVLAAVHVSDGFSLAAGDGALEELLEFLPQVVGGRGEVPVHFLETVGVDGAQRARVGLVHLQDAQGGSVVEDDGHGALCRDVDAARLREEIRLGAGLRQEVMLAAVDAELIGWHRLAEIVALELLAADGLQERDLLRRLHALGECVHAELLRHGYDSREQLAARRVERAQEVHVELDDVELIVLEHVEGGVAAAEVVEPDLIAARAESLDAVADELAVLDKRVLRDLDAQQVAREVVFLHDAFDERDRVGQGEV